MNFDTIKIFPTLRLLLLIGAFTSVASFKLSLPAASISSTPFVSSYISALWRPHINKNLYRDSPIRKSLIILKDSIVSPFASGSEADIDASETDDDELPLTRENVEKVLDEMRPYLQSDGGNVMLSEIDGPIVRLELQGACGTCPSSSMTMKMGLERRLKERIPEIAEVVQVIPNAPRLTSEAVEGVLDGVRPFLSIAGGKIGIVSLTGVGGLQPIVTLKMEGTAAALQSVKVEIMQRIQRHFMMSLKIEWV